MPAALAGAATALHQPGLLSAAVADTAVFTPHLLTATGPDNLWGPAPVDSSQIAYGAGARVLALLAVATATHSAGLRQLAGIAAGWFFGQNPAGVATYNPATGATDDGINANGTVNNLVHVIVGGQGRSGGLAEAGYHVHHAVRHAGLGDEPGQAQRGQRGLLGGLEDHAVAGSERRTELPRGHQQREVPRDDLPDHAERLAQGIGVEVRGRAGAPSAVPDMAGSAGGLCARDVLGGGRIDAEAGVVRDDIVLGTVRRAQTRVEPASGPAMQGLTLVARRSAARVSDGLSIGARSRTTQTPTRPAAAGRARAGTAHSR